MKNISSLVFATVASFLMSVVSYGQPRNSINSKAYNVKWNTPSSDAWESMPLSGRYGAGANVWVQDGSLWLYLAHNMAYDENGRLMKLGALRITPSNEAFKNIASFSQELDIYKGTISIVSVSNRGSNLNLKLWFSDENLVIESTSKQSVILDLGFGCWRDQKRDSLYLDMGKRMHALRPDSVVMDKKGIVWFHQNSAYPSSLADELKKQSIDALSINNPTENNVFGGAIVCNRLLTSVDKKPVYWQRWSGTSWNMKTANHFSHNFVISLRAGKSLKPEKWREEAHALLLPAKLNYAALQQEKRWNEFWNRSYIHINKQHAENDSAWTLGRNYQLFRYMLASNQNGQLPLLFNGGIFTMDNFDKIKGNNNDEINRKTVGPSTPDMRHWLFCGFMAQNQRWLGWPTIANGDIDLLEASNAFYRIHQQSAASRAKAMGAEGVVYPEAIQVWGLTWWPIQTGQCGAAHLRYAFAMMLENAWMTLHGHTSLGKDISSDMDWIKGAVKFYDSYYRNETKRLTGKELDPNGRLSFYPANSIEMLVGAKNPIEVVAGLRRICDALIKLSPNLISLNEKAYFANLLSILPELPVAEMKGKMILMPAASFEKEYNLWELPELYASWPYRLHNVARPGTAQIAQNTWDLLPQRRIEKLTQDYSWMPVAVNMAALGNTTEAEKRILAKLGNFNPQARFPAFFGPGHDWVPDFNWGGSGMVGLQEMLMSADPYGDGKIYLLPAWPEKWDVDFKLHAPQQTTIEVSVVKGKITRLDVFPASRKKDIVVNPVFKW